MRFETERHRLAEAMGPRGRRDSRWIRRAVDGSPRHLFAPDRLWRWQGDGYAPVDRAGDEQRWAATVYGGPYDPTVIQVTGGRATASLSCPAIVADMLDALRVQPDHRVLELGTGAGWNAALLAQRAGPDRVTSVELDPELAARALERLDLAGAQVAVRVADGDTGWPPRAPYDRLICTYAVPAVPWTWVAQIRPGGRIVTPWGRLGHVALTVANDGRSASGPVRGLATFMPSRTSPATADWREVRGDRPPHDSRPLTRDLRPLDDPHLRFALRVALPEVRVIVRENRGVTVWLHDAAASWATLSAPDHGAGTVHQGGPRHLVEELTRAWDGWLAAGGPKPSDFGMTVEAHRQYVWCRDATAGPRWPV